MTTITLDDVRKAWEPYRGCVNWHSRRGYLQIHMPFDVGPSPMPYNADINSMMATTTRITIAAEDIGWRCADGTTYEWWNIMWQGRIIDFEWYEKP